MKKASVSEFKGKKYVNIREYYVDKASGEERPGSKGIALSVEQWQELKKLVSLKLDEYYYMNIHEPTYHWLMFLSCRFLFSMSVLRTAIQSRRSIFQQQLTSGSSTRLYATFYECACMYVSKIAKAYRADFLA